MRSYVFYAPSNNFYYDGLIYNLCNVDCTLFKKAEAMIMGIKVRQFHFHDLQQGLCLILIFCKLGFNYKLSLKLLSA